MQAANKAPHELAAMSASSKERPVWQHMLPAAWRNSNTTP